MKRTALSLVVISFIRPDVALALEPEFSDLMTLPAPALEQDCRNRAISISAEDWHQRRAPDAFQSLEDIYARMDAVKDASEKGCNQIFLLRMLDCTQTDEQLSPNIVPLGKTASTPAEMAKIIDACLGELATKGITARL